MAVRPRHKLVPLKLVFNLLLISWFLGFSKADDQLLEKTFNFQLDKNENSETHVFLRDIDQFPLYKMIIRFQNNIDIELSSNAKAKSLNKVFWKSERSRSFGIHEPSTCVSIQVGGDNIFISFPHEGDKNKSFAFKPEMKKLEDVRRISIKKDQPEVHMESGENRCRKEEHAKPQDVSVNTTPTISTTVMATPTTPTMITSTTKPISFLEKNRDFIVYPVIVILLLLICCISCYVRKIQRDMAKVLHRTRSNLSLRLRQRRSRTQDEDEDERRGCGRMEGTESHRENIYEEPDYFPSGRLGLPLHHASKYSPVPPSRTPFPPTPPRSPFLSPKTPSLGPPRSPTFLSPKPPHPPPTSRCPHLPPPRTPPLPYTSSSFSLSSFHNLPAPHSSQHRTHLEVQSPPRVKVSSMPNVSGNTEANNSIGTFKALSFRTASEYNNVPFTRNGDAPKARQIAKRQVLESADPELYLEMTQRNWY